MATYYSPRVVTDGLIICLDAGNPKSYPGSGYTWSDISNTNYDCTLWGSPTYSNANGGTINFASASLQYAETNRTFTSISNWTTEAWVNFTTVPSSNSTVSAIITNSYNGSNLNFALTTDVDGTANKGIYAAFFDGAWRYAPYHSPSAGVWYHYVGTYDGATIKLYVNGNLYSSFSYAGTPSSGGYVRIARRWDSLVTSGNFINGSIPIVRVYNKALNSSEVLQNYNATKGRFGL